MKHFRARFLALIALTAPLATLVSPAFAAGTPRLEATPVIGKDAPWVFGWNEAIVTLDNSTGGAFRGAITVEKGFGAHGRGEAALVRVPVVLAAGESARVLVPFFLTSGMVVEVVVRDESDEQSTSVRLMTTVAGESMAALVEVQGDAPRGDKLLALPAAGESEPGGDDDSESSTSAPPKKPAHASPPGAWAAPQAQVFSAQYAKETHDPLLADVSSAWNGVAMVAIPSDALVRLSGRPLEALEQWVIDGGTLAIGVTREEDLKTERLKSLLGGDVRMTTPVGDEEMKFAGETLSRALLSRTGDDGDYARHGLGEVWLTRRNPWTKRISTDSQRAMYSLWERARDRRSSLVVGSASIESQVNVDAQVGLQQALDPNQSFRPAIGVAAVLVALYAVLVGPISFALARKRGRPLDVLKLTPAIALGMFVVLVVIGRVGKGFSGRARRLELIDVAAGTSHGSSRRYESLFTDDPMRIARSVDHATDVVRVLDSGDDEGVLTVEREGISVGGVRARPWQTVYFESVGSREIPGEIVLEGSGSALTLTNHTRWTLEHVVLHPQASVGGPTPRSRYFRKVAPGEIAVARDGVTVDRHVSPDGFAAESPSPLFTRSEATSRVSFQAAMGLFSAWEAHGMGTLEALPTQVPMATMLVHGAGGSASLAGLNVDRDDAFVRVVGSVEEAKKKDKSETPNPLKPKGKEGAL